MKKEDYKEHIGCNAPFIILIAVLTYGIIKLFT